MKNSGQPWMNAAFVSLSAPAQAWSGVDGDMGAAPIDGFYYSDTRVLARNTLTVNGMAPVPVQHERVTATTALFVALARNFAGTTADPRVRIDRRREVSPQGLRERIVVHNALSKSAEVTLRVVLGLDSSDMQAIKSGAGADDSNPTNTEAVSVTPRNASIEIVAGPVKALLTAVNARVDTGAGAGAGADADMNALSLEWPVVVEAHSEQVVEWSLDVEDATSAVAAASGSAEWAGVQVTSGDSRLTNWSKTALGDLAALRMTARDVPGEPFLAAGAPWFFTLFGRDSLWAARFLLPYGTEIAASTLRALSHFQSIDTDMQTGAQPGKILHELRARAFAIPGEHVTLPSKYYGTIDATPLWISLLRDAWRWGMADADVEELLPSLQAALLWVREVGDSDGDGFLEYVDTTGHGLANQGWKDSGDSIQWRDGTLAAGPIALCEVQGYAYEAARAGAELLEHFGAPGAEECLAWAATLKRRFHDSFWIEDETGAFPAVALDKDKRAVDTVTSNIGHLLGTGILDAPEARLIADRLLSPELNSGFGIRTMSVTAEGYWPLSYHGGSIWAHDTAISILGLSREGFDREAGILSEGLLAAAEGFDFQMPELFSGDSRAAFGAPVPYPAACRPQAWSAAASAVVVQALLALAPTQSGQGVSVAPLDTPLARDLSVVGIRSHGAPMSVTVDANGRVSVDKLAG